MVHKELLDVSKGNKFITMEDLSNLKLTQAAIWETQRLRSIVPLGVPHGADEVSNNYDYF